MPTAAPTAAKCVHTALLVARSIRPAHTTVSGRRSRSGFGSMPSWGQDTADDVPLSQLYPSPLPVVVHEPPHKGIGLKCLSRFPKICYASIGPLPGTDAKDEY